MSNAPKLFTPGPVEVHPSILTVMGRQPLHHRSDEFKEISKRVWERLQQVFLTQSRVLVLAGSGMTGIEASLASVHQPGDKILILNNGRFAERLATVARIHGLEVETHTVAWGQSIDADDVVNKLDSVSDVRGLWLVQSETSTGVSLDVKSIALKVREKNADMIIGVDAITSLGVQELRTDDWGLDIVVTGLQKGLGAPPGLACVALSERATTQLDSTRPRSYTLDLSTVLSDHRKGLFTWTPPTSLVAALDVALGLILSDGLESRWLHHKRMAERLKSGLQELGYSLFGEASSYALAVVSHTRSDSIIERLKKDHQIIVAGGQDQLKGKVFRVGTMGNLDLHDMDVALEALKEIDH